MLGPSQHVGSLRSGSLDTQLLHPSLERRGLQPEQTGGAFGTAHPPASLFQDRDDVIPLDVLQAADAGLLGSSRLARGPVAQFERRALRADECALDDVAVLAAVPGPGFPLLERP